MTPQEIQSRAFDDFGHWQSFQPQDVLDMPIVQQAAHYAADSEWHARPSDDEYRWRFAAP